MRQEHHSQGLLGHPTMSPDWPRAGQAGDGPTSHKRNGGNLQCETKALPAPCTGERVHGEAVSLQGHSWMEPPAFHGGRIVQDHPVQDCPVKRGVNQGTCARLECATPSSPRSWHSQLHSGLHSSWAPSSSWIRGGQQAKSELHPSPAGG